MSKKKLVSLALACIMLVVLAVPVFAAGDNTPSASSNNNTVVTGAYQDIPIDVTVSTTGSVVLNPYGLPYKVAKSTGAEITVSGQQFVNTSATYISNLSEVDLNATVSGTVTAKGGLIISAAAVASSAVVKQANIKLEVMGVSASTSEAKLLALTADPDEDQVSDAVLDVMADNSLWTAANGMQSVTLGVAKATIANPVLLKAATAYQAEVTSGDATAGEIPFAYNTGSVAVFRLTGTMASNPTTPWAEASGSTAADGFEATIVFTFAPAA